MTDIQNKIEELRNLINSIEEMETESIGKLGILYNTGDILNSRRKEDPNSFSEENQSYLGKLAIGIKKLENRIFRYGHIIKTLSEAINLMNSLLTSQSEFINKEKEEIEKMVNEGKIDFSFPNKSNVLGTRTYEEIYRKAREKESAKSGVAILSKEEIDNLLNAIAKPRKKK